MENNIKAYVYLITNLVDGKVYVGKPNDPKRRWKEHRCSILITKKRTCSYLHRALLKYGILNFKFEVIDILSTEEDAYKSEIEYITKFNSHNAECGYNLHGGGRGGYSPSIETREKLRVSSTGKKHSQEAKDKVRCAQQGRKASEETKQKMSLAHKGQQTRLGSKASDETKAKQHIAKLGHTWTPAQRIAFEKLRQTSEYHAHMSKMNRGIKWSDERKAKHSTTLKIAWAIRKASMYCQNSLQ